MTSLRNSTRKNSIKKVPKPNKQLARQRLTSSQKRSFFLIRTARYATSLTSFFQNLNLSVI